MDIYSLSCSLIVSVTGRGDRTMVEVWFVMSRINCHRRPICWHSIYLLPQTCPEDYLFPPSNRHLCKNSQNPSGWRTSRSEITSKWVSHSACLLAPRSTSSAASDQRRGQKNPKSSLPPQKLRLSLWKGPSCNSRRTYLRQLRWLRFLANFPPRATWDRFGTFRKINLLLGMFSPLVRSGEKDPLLEAKVL